MNYFNENNDHYFYENVGGGVVFIFSMMMNVNYEVYMNYFLGDHTKIAPDFIRLAKDEYAREKLLRHKVEATDDSDITKYERIKYEVAYEKCSLLDNIYKVNDFTSKLEEDYSLWKKVNKECSELEEKLNKMTRDEVLQYKLANYKSPLCHESFDLQKEQIIKQILFSKRMFDICFRDEDK